MLLGVAFREGNRGNRLDPAPRFCKPLRERRHNPARQHEQDDDQHVAIRDPLRFRRHDRAQKHRQQPEDHAADDRTDERSLAAGDYHDHHRHRVDEGKHLGIDDPDVMCVETAGCSCNPGRDHRCQREGLCHIDTDGYRQRFVFHQPAHGAAEMRMDQARDQQIGDNRDGKHEVVVLQLGAEGQIPETWQSNRNRGDVGQRQGALRQLDPVQRHQPDHFGKGNRHDHEIGAADAKRQQPHEISA